MNMHVSIDITIRRSIEDAIERLLTMLDALDGDPDLEDGGDDEPEPLEPSLAGANSDLEEDPAEYDGQPWSNDTDLSQDSPEWQGVW